MGSRGGSDPNRSCRFSSRYRFSCIANRLLGIILMDLEVTTAEAG